MSLRAFFGLYGLIITAFLAAIMSSLDSTLAADALLPDIGSAQLQPSQTSKQTLIATGRCFTMRLTVVAVGTACYAPPIEGFGSLFQCFQSTLAHLMPPTIAVYLGGNICSHFTTAGASAVSLAVTAERTSPNARAAVFTWEDLCAETTAARRASLRAYRA